MLFLISIYPSILCYIVGVSKKRFVGQMEDLLFDAYLLHVHISQKVVPEKVRLFLYL